ncbi:DUF3592 domain-containing protein [Nocardioides jiangxiensis]|uniref:DUF3592 domain-containing protein n=1 Tax=Nocardioides jiangxiensis TaxID=3064524 RepID=A0ABT9AX43_9ACTN|nr:DUF3592 domain-containing protein [Nocardioides sp. WY-20]MDO7867094.1 DUF3592 domain-containing protein [Nocardioides sp. WY-20]
MSIRSKASELVAQARAEVEKHESTDPYVAGRVRQVIGGVLIADGLVGLENPFGRRSRPGILGALVFLGLGLVFVVLGPIVMTRGVDVDATATGRITQVSAPDSDRTCSATATFEVGGSSYRAMSEGSSSGLCKREVGDRIEVRYDSADPSQNRIGVSVFGIVGWVFLGVGLLFSLIGLVLVALRAGSIYFGWKLWRSGGRMVRANPPTPGADDLASRAKADFLRVLRGGGSIGSGLAGAMAPTGAASSAGVTAPSVVAPDVVAAGWYPTADGTHERWHDGSGWTDQVRPRSS